MSLIGIKNLTFGYDGKPNIFDNASFNIDTDWKLGLVGRNGRGKTTFLNLLAGKLEYEGEITSKVRFSYFPFGIKNRARTALDVLSEICPDAEEWEMMRELSYLNISADALYRPFDTFSGGECTKLMLAGLFLRDGNFLLIDEPTNHLDASARETVAEYLRRKKGFILVSHDRAFLDGCVDHIMSINRSDIELQSGNFSSYMENFERRQAFETAQNEKLKKDIARLTEAAKRTAEWSDRTEESKYGKTSAGLKPDRGYVGHKSAKLMKRAKVTETRVMQAAEQKAGLLRNTETVGKLKLSPLVYHSDRLLNLRDAEAVYDGRKVCLPVTFDLRRGDRIALEGENGSGKSSILKMIAGEKIDRFGEVTVASGLIISYVPQTSDHVKGSLSEFAEERGIDESLLKAVLNKMDFRKDDFDGDISSFSEGQKKKVLIAGSLCERAHLYVWDEPLNYIDIYSRMQIENLLTEFQPTMIFVEHDKAFRNKVATRTVVVKKA